MTHFTPRLFGFLKKLKRNNDREWFKKHKDEYLEHVRDPMLRFIEDARPGLLRISRHLVADPSPVGGSMFRVHRDTRFSKDKTPYKLSASAKFQHEEGKNVHTPGYYLHLGLDGVFIGTGIWHPDSPTLELLRRRIVDDTASWKRVVNGKHFKDESLRLVGDALKRPPRGFDPEHPFIEDLKRKDFIAVTDLDEETACAPDFLETFISVCRNGKPLTRWVAETLELAFLKLMLAIVALALGTAPASSAPPHPNIVLIVADDLGWGDVGCFGGDLETPRIDGMARDGMTLTDFYAAAPVCTPSRFAMLTGRIPMRAQGGLGGVIMLFDEGHRDRGLRAGERTIADVLRAAGYSTALVGKWHLGHGAAEHMPTRHGFEFFRGALGGCIDYYEHGYAFVDDWYHDEEPVVEAGYATDLVTAHAVRYIDEHAANGPFFLTVSHFAPHYGKSCADVVSDDSRTLVTRKAGAPRTDDSGAVRQPVNTLQVRAGEIPAEPSKRAYFAGMVRALDDSVGAILDAVARNDLNTQTIVILTADNGPDATISSAGSSGPWRGAKHSLYEGGIRVPTVVRWTGTIEAGASCPEPGGLVDLMPTLLNIAGAQPSRGMARGMDGIDLSPAWLNGDSVGERVLVWRHGTVSAIRRGPWKLVGNELYNLTDDRAEANDLAAAHPELVRELGIERARRLAE